jgi:hypothetical protein
MRDFFQWFKAVVIMIPVTVYVLVIGILFYAYIRLRPKDVGGCSGGYCDHFDDLL